MADYDFAAIERRWQEFWLDQEAFRVANPGEDGFDPERPKYFVLDMFPYPSGSGLHVGHPKGYTATDIVARFKRHRGFHVLHPMGWDAFGLPAEQYAIQTGTQPRETTEKNIARFREQLQGLGLSYDWSREINTTDPKYFRWTQWIFQQLFKRDLAYQAEIPVWWCEELKTVLANEEVVDGHSERGGHPCVKRPLRQWMLRITAYAERLLADLEGLDWPDSVKAMQREWIGRSEGAEIVFPLEVAADPIQGKIAARDGAQGNAAVSFSVFTKRPDTLFGVTFCVLSPEHPLVEKITTAEQLEKVLAYRKEATGKSDLERAELQKDKTGVWTGAYALNPAVPENDSRRRIPVWIADYVLMSYGTGAIMCVPGGDQRDRDFAEVYGLPIVEIEKDDGTLQHSDWLDGLSFSVGQRKMCSWLEEHHCGRATVTYRLRDWLFSRQRYWGEPFPLLRDEDGNIQMVPEGDLPVTLPELDDFSPGDDGEPPLARATSWLQVEDENGKSWRRETNSMPQWAGSCWYYLRFCDPQNESAAWDPAIEKYWMPVDLYVGGAEHAVLHLLYARFWHKVLFDAGLVSTNEPFQKLVNQGMVQAFAFRDSSGSLVARNEVKERDGGFVRASDGAALDRFSAKMSKSLRNVVNPDEVIQEFGADTMRLYEAFMGPITASAPWNPRDLPGVHRFLQRVWRLFDQEFAAEADADVERALHACTRKVTEDLENLAFNTAIAGMMEFVNMATKGGHALSKDQGSRFALLLEPFAPHLGEELWQKCCESTAMESCSSAVWPTWDASQLVKEAIEIPVQINGKIRARITVAADLDSSSLEEAAKAAVADHLEGKSLRKTVVIPGRMVNLVVAT